MTQLDGAPPRKAWPFAVASAFFAVAAVLSALDGSYWLALCQASSTGVMGLLWTGADERGGAWAAFVWVLLGVSVVALVGVVAG